jgi:ABC-type nickel/cobalt efflux system permease component RcnA
MANFTTLLSQGNSWLFVPSAILLGALHGLEPGHSKTMMAAFIVAIRGTLGQAVLLGLAATLSHTAVVWAIALGGLYFGKQWNTETTEPYFQVASAVLIIAVALWMVWRTWRQRAAFDDHSPDHHGHDHDHDHGHGHDDVRRIDTGHGVVRPRFRLSSGSGADPHELAHANDIRRRFANREVTTGQIVMFGLTGGLIPCPASITVLLLCLQLKKFALGATLVLCFSIGLALTMVTSGAIAALGVKHASRRFSGFGELARNAPYFSAAVIVLVGFYVGYQGLRALA